MSSPVTGGVSTSWTLTFSNGIMKGAGERVVKGYSATSTSAPVRALTRLDFPEFGGPATTICPAPDLSILWVGACLAMEARRSPSSRALAIFCRYMAMSLSVPLWWGMTRMSRS